MEGTGGFVLYRDEVSGRHTEHVEQIALPGRALELARREESGVALWEVGREFSTVREWPDFLTAWERLFGIATAALSMGGDSAPPEERDRRELMKSLLAERAGALDPRVFLLFEEGALDWFAELDGKLGGEHEGRPVAAASRHLGELSDEARRSQVAAALGEGARLLLGADVLAFVPTRGHVPKGVPLLSVRSNLEPGTSVYEVEGRPELYVELRTVVRVEVRTGDGRTTSLDLELESPDAFTATRQSGQRDSIRTSIYTEMLRRVLDELSYEFARSFGWSPTND